MQAAKNPDEVDKLLKSLDFNGDAEVDFQEYVILVSSLTCAVHGRAGRAKWAGRPWGHAEARRQHEEPFYLLLLCGK